MRNDFLDVQRTAGFFTQFWEILLQMGRHPVFVSLIGGDLVCRGRYYLSVLLWYLGNPSIMHNIHVLFIYMFSDPKELGKYLAHGMVWITLLSTVPKCSTRISGNPIASSHHSVDPSSGSPTWLVTGWILDYPATDKHKYAGLKYTEWFFVQYSTWRSLHCYSPCFENLRSGRRIQSTLRVTSCQVTFKINCLRVFGLGCAQWNAAYCHKSAWSVVQPPEKPKNYPLGPSNHPHICRDEDKTCLKHHGTTNIIQHHHVSSASHFVAQIPAFWWRLRASALP